MLGEPLTFALLHTGHVLGIDWGTRKPLAGPAEASMDLLLTSWASGLVSAWASNGSGARSGSPTTPLSPPEPLSVLGGRRRLGVS